jgi:hypothetical protein
LTDEDWRNRDKPGIIGDMEQLWMRPIAHGEQLIESIDDLKAWMDGIPQRHQKVSDRECSCGWRAMSQDVLWDAHADGGPVRDLAEFVPSRVFDSTLDRDLSCAEFEVDADIRFAHASAEEDYICDVLASIALGAPEPQRLAAALLARLQPGSGHLIDISRAGVAVDPELVPEPPPFDPDEFLRR